MTRVCRYLPLLLPTLFCFQFASAQSTFDFNMGFGFPHDKANPAGIDTNTGLPCSSSTLHGACAATSSLGSFMVGVGGNLMLWKHFGVGASANIQPPEAKYAVLEAAEPGSGQGETDFKTRATFYQLDGIYQPYSTRKASLQVIAGVGGTRIKFYEIESGARIGTLLGYTSSGSYVYKPNHVQVHGGVGMQIYFSGNFFIRPEFDIHYVDKFVQFGSNVVMAGTVWVGYSIGSR